MPAGYGWREGIGVETSASRGDSVLDEREVQIWLAKPKLTAELNRRYTHRPFTYIHFHNVPRQDVVLTQDDSLGEVKTVTVQRSSVFPPGEVQFAICLGNEYLVVDWNDVMTDEEKMELAQKQAQDLGSGWRWRRGSIIKPF